MAPGPIGSEDAKKLASLGYLSTGASGGPGPLADPKDEIGTVRLLKQAMGGVKAGRPAEAAAFFRSLLDKNPRMFDVWELYSETLLALGRTDEALAARRKLVELSPQASGLLLSVANLCLEIGRSEEAIRNARLAKERGDTAADEVLARALFAKGDLASAEAAARRAMETGKARRSATLTLARILAARGDAKKALEVIDGLGATLSAQAVPMGFHYTRGDALARLDLAADAEAEFREEIRLFPEKSVDARILLAITYAAQHKTIEAQKTISELIADVPTPDAYVKSVKTLSAFGDRAAAEALRRDGLRRFPQDARLRSVSAHPL